MARIDTFQNWATDVAESIRTKTGKTDKIPAASFDTEIAGIQTKEDLDTELTVQNEEITEQEDLLYGIEELLNNKQNGGSAVNVFMQPKEPTKKEGIWFETGDYKYTDLAIMNELPDLSPKEWKSFTSNRDRVFQHSAVACGDNFYIFGGRTYSSGGTSWSNGFNCKAGNMWSLAYCTILQADMYSTVAIDNVIYFIGGWDTPMATDDICKYDIASNTYSRIGTLPAKRCLGRAVAIGTDIYHIGGKTGSSSSGTKNIYKFDTLTNTITESITGPIACRENYVAAIGTDIYIIGDGGTSTSAYKFDTLTNTSVQIADTPITGIGTALVYNNKIYLFPMESTDVYRYDPDTDTYEIVPILKRKVARYYNIMLAGSDGFYDTCGSPLDDKYTPTSAIYKFPYEYLNAKNYDTDMAIVLQQEENQYSTELVTPGNIIDGNRLLTNFNDADYYNATDKEIKTLPTYYGDGNGWIKIKN